MITTFYPPYNFGGDGIYVHRLCQELARRGHVIDVVHCIDAYKALERRQPEEEEYAQHRNITIHALKSRAGILSPLLTQQTGHSFFKKKTIKKLVSENEYDVIHFHNTSLIGLEALTFGEAIKLCTLHDYWLVCPMHMLWKYNREICEERNCIRCQFMGKRPAQWWRYTKFMEKKLIHVDTLISPSLFAKRKHQELGLDVPIAHLPSFLPVPATGNPQPKKKSPVRRQRPYFLFVGRLEKIKGVQNVIPAFRKYRTCDLLVAGDGEYAPALKDLAKDVPNVKFLGRLSYQRLTALYQEAVAVIVSSVCYEIFSLVVIESFAERTPLIVNNQGALPELVQQSGGGLIYSNEKELIEHMERCSQDKQLRNELGKRGYLAYRKYWTDESHLEQYFQLIKEVAGKKNKTNPAIDAL